MKRFNILVPEELHRRFKVVCVMEGTDMSEVLRKMMEEYVERAEKRLKLKK